MEEVININQDNANNLVKIQIGILVFSLVCLFGFNYIISPGTAVFVGGVTIIYWIALLYFGFKGIIVNSKFEIKNSKLEILSWISILLLIANLVYLFVLNK